MRPPKLTRIGRCLFLRGPEEVPTYIRAVPQDLRLVIGKGQLWRRLSDDLYQARMQARDLRLQHDQMFARLRSREVRRLIEAEGGAKAVRLALDLLYVDQACAALLNEDPGWRGDMLPANLPDLTRDEISTHVTILKETDAI